MVEISVSELVRAFEELADLSEIKGEVAFKANAYRKAAELVRSIGEELLEKQGISELREYPGIGEGIAKKILEFTRTGRITKLEELKEEIPVELVALLKVPNLGPRRAKLVFDELGVRTIDDLQRAAESGELAKLKGLGPKAEANILEGIRTLQSTSGRLLLSQAYEMAEEIIGRMEERIPDLKIESAGSLRRMKETIGDIDILVAIEEGERAMEAFCSLPMVERVIARGDTKSSIVTHQGLQVDLRVVSPESWGAALQYFTGSKDHNIRVREIAKKRGMKINEYGVFIVAEDKKVAGLEEEEVYRVLGMDLPVPELRENRGEIEAAQQGRLPTLVELKDIRGDFHAHTRASDGFHTLEEMREEAERLGYRFLGICNHAAALRVAGGLSREALLQEIEEIRRLNERGDSPVVLLAGCELNIGNEGEVDYDQGLLRELDFTVASIHGGFRQSREQIHRRLIRAMENPYVRIIGHPSGRLIGQRSPYEVDLHQILRVAAETGTAMELNAFPDRLDLADEYLQEAKELGVKIAIGTDAHRREHLRYMFYGVATARRGWLEKADVLNAWSKKELEKWLTPT